ncbi:MAG: Y-family DNA polymerase, partial [Rhizobiaceae bacterium]
MRKPTKIECLYLDFDGFFASVEQQARPHLRGKPVGIIPFEGTEYTCVIAASKEAKASGCSNVMTYGQAVAICPDIILQPQTPDLYRRAHNTLIAEIEAVIPVDAVKSIDEITCRLDAEQAQNPERLAQRIKERIARYVGPYITCSIGFAPNRQLAKIAGKQNKPDGVTIWRPEQMPTALYVVPFSEIPGIGSRMEQRLQKAGIGDMEALMSVPPKHMRKLWGSVLGERLWYALHGYAIQAEKPERGMFGHGRVLPPELRERDNVKPIARMLVIKAARRMRKGGYYASRLFLWCNYRQSRQDKSYSDSFTLPVVCDDHACLSGLNHLWHRLCAFLTSKTRIVRVGVVLGELSVAGQRQLDMLLDDDNERRRWERVNR